MNLIIICGVGSGPENYCSGLYNDTFNIQVFNEFLLLLQVAPLYVLAFIFALHTYIRPYKHTAQNIVEIAILLNYIVLLLLRFPQPLLDALNAEYSGTMVPTMGPDQQLPEHDNLTWFFVPIFYFPLVMGMGVVSFWIFYKTW